MLKVNAFLHPALEMPRPRLSVLCETKWAESSIPVDQAEAVEIGDEAVMLVIGEIVLTELGRLPSRSSNETPACRSS
jgi:hypothetical protein